ncbi:DNA ligase LigA-related protein [Bacillus subtilis]|uniref:DNA ligase LigA-related protein n=1 Tax=Bacillus subtilis TaxID=1423 RepID=UPI00129E87A3|nr:hypothetical protein [Bacillus subtilis]NRF01913.1 hypothetical protein [Bacillus subtilis]NRG37181.1 hypothetical protein [Bacillus subtilis]QGI31231.1 hypothetical protein GII85_11520 [Bacillus subtilis]WHX51885.1 hypothetical protein QNH30_11625 [Bacillus subtilis]WHX55887.1 hypothetical protein QNK02_11625 [Bacillus subtilis]
MDKDILELIGRRRRQILVHSFLYYQLNENIIADYTFDLWSKELVQLQEKYPEESKKAVYYAEFTKFDGSSGYDLPYRLPEIQNTGYKLLEYHKRGRD